jgi:hypothetical protein
VCSARTPRGWGLGLLGAAGLVVELGFAILWMVSFRLTHNQEFTIQYLAQFPVFQRTLDGLFAVARWVVPNIEPPPDLNLPTAVLVVGCVVAGLGYLGGLVVLDRGWAAGGAALGLVLGFAALFQATVLVMPGLFSQDIFGYLEYGQIPAIHGLNPYIWPPSAFAHDPLLLWVAPIWRTLPSPYGPTWTDLNWALAHVLYGRSIIDQVEAYKLLANVLHVLTLGLVWWLLGRLGSHARTPGGERASAPPRGDPDAHALGRMGTLEPDDGAPRARLVAFTLFAWNPLVLFESPGNGHNDALALFLLLLAFAPLVLGRPRPARVGSHATDAQALGRVGTVLDARYLGAVVLLTLSGFVKYLSAVVGPLLLVAWARQLDSWRARLAVVVVAGVVAGLVTLLLFAPWLELPDSLDPVLSQTGGTLYANALPDLVSITISDELLVPSGMPLPAARAAVRGAMKLLVDAVFVAYLAWEVWQLWRAAAPGGVVAARALVRSSTRVLLVVILVVSIWVQTWYYVMPLALAALLGWRDTLAKTVVAYTLMALPVLYTHYYLQEDVPDGIFWLYGLLPLLVPLVAWLGARRRPRAPVTLAAAAPTPGEAEPVASLAGVYDA